MAPMEQGDATDLIPIGRFARLAGLSIGALRHYDELDLLRPADVDRFTGYRRYRGWSSPERSAGFGTSRYRSTRSARSSARTTRRSDAAGSSTTSAGCRRASIACSTSSTSLDSLAREGNRS